MALPEISWRLIGTPEQHKRADEARYHGFEPAKVRAMRALHAIEWDDEPLNVHDDASEIVDAVMKALRDGN